jgi:hypothetical protein
VSLIARVFPRKTKATPTDGYFGGPGLFPPDVDEVHISVAFTWDVPKAEWLAKQWQHVAPVKIGGPAFYQPSGEFIPGLYVKQGYVITSRGCPNRCWFCSVWKREPKLIELPVHNGNNLLDDNILACSDAHILKVFEMLKHQCGVEFTGGLEAKILKPWHVKALKEIKPRQMFFAYDTPDDYEPLGDAALMLTNAGFNRNQMRCYVLIGYQRDTIEQAESRLRQAYALGYLPMAMLWRNEQGKVDYEWKKFQRLWARPAITKKVAA